MEEKYEEHHFYHSSRSTYERYYKIGSGEQGEVYKVKDVDNNTYWALKTSTCSIEEHAAEVKTQVKLKTICCRVYDSWWVNGNGYIVMELVNCTLYQYLGEERSVTSLIRIIKAINHLLNTLDDNKIIHGDMALFNIGVIYSSNLRKPENFKIKLLDCGNSLSGASYSMLEKQLDFLRIWVEVMATDDDRSCDSNDVCNEQNMSFLRSNFPKFMLRIQKELIWNTIDDLYTRVYHELNESEIVEE